jgi:site-specific recombinase XerD
MPSERLTPTAIGALKGDAGKQVNYFDTKLTGFGVRLSARTATYFIQCRCKTRKNTSGHRLEIRESLGRVRRDDHGNVDLAQYKEVCNRARGIIDDAEKDITPDDKARIASEHREIEARGREIEEAKNITLGDLFDRFLSMKSAKDKLKPSTIGQYNVSMRAHFADWLVIPARNISPEMVETRHVDIGKEKKEVYYTTNKGNRRKGIRGGKGAADLAMRTLRAVLSYGTVLYEDVFIKNPVKILSKTGCWYNLGRKTSFISKAQLKPWFQGLEKIKNPKIRTVLIVGLFTGERKLEVMGLKWSDVDLDSGIGTFRKTKNNKILTVPIAQYAIDSLKKYKETSYSGPDGYVFASYGKTGHLRDIRESMNIVAEESGVDFMFNDFRRTFLTICNAVGVPIWTQKRLVNHANPERPYDVTEGYVQHEMDTLRYFVEAVAQYILTNAGLSPATPVIRMPEHLL